MSNSVRIIPINDRQSTERLCKLLYEGNSSATRQPTIRIEIKSQKVEYQLKSSKKSRIIHEDEDSQNIDFITDLLCTPQKYDSIRVMVNRLTKSAHLLPVRTTFSTKDYARLYIRGTVRLHEVPIYIISERGAQFIANFWRSFQKRLGHIRLSTTFYPQIDG